MIQGGAITNKVARPGTVVEVHGVEKVYPDLSRYHYFVGLHLVQVIDNALKAEKEGCDAFICGGLIDILTEKLISNQILCVPALW